MTESQLDTETLRGLIARELTAARQRTALLTDCVDDTDLTTQHSPLMSPLVWDLAHIANQEELWLLREVGGREPMHPEIDPLYDAFEHPRTERPKLPLLPPAQARAYGHEVRGRVLDLLDRARFSVLEHGVLEHGVLEHGVLEHGVLEHGGTQLLGAGFAFGMIAQHEVQHDETMLITHQIRAGARCWPHRRPARRRPTRSGCRRRSWYPAARSPWGPRPSRGHWTTSGPRTPCPWRRSSSIPRR